MTQKGGGSLDYIRIGRFELYISGIQFEWPKKTVCGCVFTNFMRIGVTFLGKDCRPSQGNKFFAYVKYDDLD